MCEVIVLGSSKLLELVSSRYPAKEFDYKILGLRSKQFHKQILCTALCCSCTC